MLLKNLKFEFQQVYFFIDLQEQEKVSLQKNLLKNNKKLEEIYLDGNEITSLPDKIFNAQGIYLKRVELGENKLTSLPSSIGKAIELLTMFLEKLERRSEVKPFAN